MAAKKKLATLLGGLQQDRLEHSERATKVNQSFVESDRDFTRNACRALGRETTFLEVPWAFHDISARKSAWKAWQKVIF